MINVMLTLVAGHELMVEMSAEIEVMVAVHEVRVAVENALMVAVHMGINWLKEPLPC